MRSGRSVNKRLEELRKRYEAGILAPQKARDLCGEFGIPESGWVRQVMRARGYQSANGTAKDLERLTDLQRENGKAQIRDVGPRARGEGNGFALFEALELCLERRLPLPQWAVAGLLAGIRHFRRQAVAELGDAFGVRSHSKIAVAKRRPRHRMISLPLGRFAGVRVSAEERAWTLLRAAARAGVSINAALFEQVGTEVKLGEQTVKRIWAEHGGLEMAAPGLRQPARASKVHKRRRL